MNRPPPPRLTALILAAITMAGLAVFYSAAIVPNIEARRFGVVEPGKVYRSGKITPSALQRLHRDHGIRTIIDLGTYEPGSPEEAREQRTADLLGVTRYRFNLEGDATGDPNDYVEALRLMSDPTLQPVLVHCGAGTERTGCAIVLYRTIVQGRSIQSAYDEAKRFDQDPGKNEWVFRMLLEWAPKIEEAYRGGGPVPGTAPRPEPEPVARIEAGP